MNKAEERNFSARVAYEGTCYAGFQLQADEPTIQGEIEKALRSLFGHEIRIQGASRTDSGVHATGQMVSFRVETGMPSAEIEKAANALLPDDISIGPVRERDQEFHARYSAKGKRYIYRVRIDDRENPFLGRYTMRIPTHPDLDAMRETAELIEGERDFRSFSPRLMEGENPVKNIDTILIGDLGPLIEIEVSGSGFMYQMVRRIAAAILGVGQGELKLDVVRDWLNNPSSGECTRMLPAKGLFLIEVFY